MEIAFSFGFLNFYWSGIILSVGIVTGFLVSWRQAKKHDLNSECLIDILLFSLLGAFIGGRMHHVALHWSFYIKNMTSMFNFWQGGLELTGSIVGILMVLLWYMRYHKLNVWVWGDVIAPGMAFGQAIGKWAGFFNQMAFGKPTNFPWGIFIDYTQRPLQYRQVEFFHPTFLYDSLCSLFIGLALLTMRRKLNQRSGVILGWYLVLYAAGSLAMSPLQLYTSLVGQFFALMLLVAGGILLYLRNKIRR